MEEKENFRVQFLHTDSHKDLILSPYLQNLQDTIEVPYQFRVPAGATTTLWVWCNPTELMRAGKNGDLAKNRATANVSRCAACASG
jgi:hypothetical protein